MQFAKGVIYTLLELVCMLEAIAQTTETSTRIILLEYKSKKSLLRKLLPELP